LSGIKEYKRKRRESPRCPIHGFPDDDNTIGKATAHFRRSDPFTGEIFRRGSNGLGSSRPNLTELYLASSATFRYSIFNVRCSMSVSRQSRHSRVVRVEFCGGQLYDPHIQTMEYMREVIPVNPVTLLAPRVSGVSTSTFNFVSMIEEYTQYSSHMADQPHRASRESLAIYPCPAADSESPYNVL
jgi:hypothetical protein